KAVTCGFCPPLLPISLPSRGLSPKSKRSCAGSGLVLVRTCTKLFAKPWSRSLPRMLVAGLPTAVLSRQSRRLLEHSIFLPPALGSAREHGFLAPASSTPSSHDGLLHRLAWPLRVGN